MTLTLMHTQDCHLCEQAVEMLAFMGISVQTQDIVESPQWVERYGVRIPVLVAGDQELGWPFEPADIVAFLESLK